MDASTRKTIGRYEVIDLLGRGAMAEVYRARDPNLGREVAIKLILPALAQEDNFERRFATEARAIAGMIHPNIVQAYDYGLSEQGPYMVMEYVAGRTLKERLKAWSVEREARRERSPDAPRKSPTSSPPSPVPSTTPMARASSTAM